MPKKILENKKIAIIIAFRDFRDVEYFVPRSIFEEAGAKVTTVSTKAGTAIGADGGDTEIDILIEQLDPADFDAIVFIGGPGCLRDLDNENSYRVLRETIGQNKLLGSICISPIILAKAGVLKEKKATVWSSPMDKSSILTLGERGAEYVADSVVVDGKLITADGPAAAREFAEKLVALLTEE